jgi:hypothetical protein
MFMDNGPTAEPRYSDILSNTIRPSVPHFLALGLRYPWSQPLIFGGLLWYLSARSYLAPVTSDLATTKLVFLAKLHTRTSQPEVPPIQIYYVKYLAMWLVWPDRFHKPPTNTYLLYVHVIFDSTIPRYR